MYPSCRKQVQVETTCVAGFQLRPSAIQVQTRAPLISGANLRKDGKNTTTRTATVATIKFSSNFTAMGIVCHYSLLLTADLDVYTSQWQGYWRRYTGHPG